MPEPVPRVVELQIDGEIEPVMAEYIAAGIEQANASGASLILITIDTPGGLDTSMRAIIQHIIDSRAPVAAYVSPSGSRAASAGFFILLAADVAAMAPGTHTGAASPLLAIGGMPVQVDETVRKKILNDATAYLRSYAGRRGRNTALAESAVTEGKAFTESEALDGKLIDHDRRVPGTAAVTARRSDDYPSGREHARRSRSGTPPSSASRCPRVSDSSPASSSPTSSSSC